MQKIIEKVRTVVFESEEKKYEIYCPNCDEMTSDYSGSGKELKCNMCGCYVYEELQEAVEVPDFNNTHEALRFGETNKDNPEAIAALFRRRRELRAKYRSLSKEGKQSEAFLVAQRVQFPREALEAAGKWDPSADETKKAVLESRPTNLLELLTKVGEIGGLRILRSSYLADGVVGIFRYEKDGNAYEIEITPVAHGKHGYLLGKGVNEGRSEKIRNYKIEANSDVLLKLDKLFAAFEYCNNGSSRSFKISYDGDGADYFKLLNREYSKEDMAEIEKEVSSGKEPVVI